MKQRVIKELAIFLFLFVFLSIWMHFKEWTDHPIEHIKSLPESQFGIFHPLVFTFFVYILILIVRIFIKIARKFIETGAKKGV